MAVTNPEIEAIYDRVAEGTPVEICPLSLKTDAGAR